MTTPDPYEYSLAFYLADVRTAGGRMSATVRNRIRLGKGIPARNQLHSPACRKIEGEMKSRD